jgi:hypothetical protein
MQTLLSTLKLVQKDTTRKRFAALSHRTMTADHLQRSEATRMAPLAGCRTCTKINYYYSKQSGNF